MVKKQLTMKEFNETYTIEVLTKAKMFAELQSVESDSVLDYGPLEEALDNISYRVYNRHNMKDFDEEFEVTEDFQLIEELKEHFDFIEDEIK